MRTIHFNKIRHTKRGFFDHQNAYLRTVTVVAVAVVIVEVGGSSLPVPSNVLSLISNFSFLPRENSCVPPTFYLEFREREGYTILTQPFGRRDSDS